MGTALALHWPAILKASVTLAYLDRMGLVPYGHPQILMGSKYINEYECRLRP